MILHPWQRYVTREDIERRRAALAAYKWDVPAKGKYLSYIGDGFNFPRRKWLFFSEPDFIYRKRLLKWILNGMTNHATTS